MFNHALKKHIGILLLLVVVGLFFSLPDVAHGVGGAPAGVPNMADIQAGFSSSLEGLFATIANRIMTAVADATLRLAGFVTWLAGGLLNYSVDLSIRDMASNVNNISGIELGWTTVRDVANIVFIFVLLYVSIGIILRLSSVSSRAMLPKVIIVALLVNFSLFFSQVIIDVSNRLALEFYNMTGVENNGKTGFAEALLTSSRVGTIYDISATRQGSTEASAAQGAVSGIQGVQDKNVAEVLTNPIELLVMAISGSVFLLVLAFVLFAAGILLAARFVILVFLMVLSPLAFVAMVLPNTAGYARSWWSSLFNQSFFAPLYFMLIWIALNIVNSDNFASLSNLGEGDTFAALILGNSVQIVFNYGIVIGFLIAALIIAQRLGAYGSSTMMKWGSTARKAGLNMVRRPVGYVAGGVAGAAARGVVNKGIKPIREAMTLRAEKSRRGELAPKQFGSGRFGKAILTSGIAGDAVSGLKSLEEKKFFGAKSVKQAKDDEKDYRVAGEQEYAKTELKESFKEYEKIKDDSAKLQSLEGQKIVTELQKALNATPDGSIVKMRTEDLETVAPFLKKTHMTAIDKTDEKSDQEKSKIWGARLAEVPDKVQKVDAAKEVYHQDRSDLAAKQAYDDAVDELKETLKKFEASDITHLEEDVLRNRNLIDSMNSKLFEKVVDDQNMPKLLKNQIEDAREQTIVDEGQRLRDILTSNPTPTQEKSARDEFTKLLRGYSPKEVAGFGADVFKNEHVVMSLDSAVLDKMIDEASGSVRASVREIFEREYGNLPPGNIPKNVENMHNFLTHKPRGVLF